MREIKFRAFNDLYAMSQPFRLGEKVAWRLSNGDLYACYSQDALAAFESAVMQFTGLKDKDGKDIYEGDIIQLDHWRPERWEVTFDRGGFCMRDKPDASYYPDCKYTEKSVVLGNIYENPELFDRTLSELSGVDPVVGPK